MNNNVFHFHNKRFKTLSNSKNGEVGDDTSFHYRQENDIIWATYQGGSIKFGTLSGYINNNQLVFTYQHQNLQGEFMTGKCESKAHFINGKIQLQEEWQWTCLDFSKGTSVLEEI